MSESQSETDRNDAVPDPEDKLTGIVRADDEMSDDGTVPGEDPEDNPDKEGEDRFDAG
jgi:hypothetical protein